MILLARPAQMPTHLRQTPRRRPHPAIQRKPPRSRRIIRTMRLLPVKNIRTIRPVMPRIVQRRDTHLHTRLPVRHRTLARDMPDLRIIGKRHPFQRIEQNLLRIVQIDTLHRIIPANRIRLHTPLPIRRPSGKQHKRHPHPAGKRTHDPRLKRQTAHLRLVRPRLRTHRRHRTTRPIRPDRPPIPVRRHRIRQRQLNHLNPLILNNQSSRPSRLKQTGRSPTNTPASPSGRFLPAPPQASPERGGRAGRGTARPAPIPHTRTIAVGNTSQSTTRTGRPQATSVRRRLLTVSGDTPITGASSATVIGRFPNAASIAASCRASRSAQAPVPLTAHLPPFPSIPFTPSHKHPSYHTNPPPPAHPPNRQPPLPHPGRHATPAFRTTSPPTPAAASAPPDDATPFRDPSPRARAAAKPRDTPEPAAKPPPSDGTPATHASSAQPPAARTSPASHTSRTPPPPSKANDPATHHPPTPACPPAPAPPQTHAPHPAPDGKTPKTPAKSAARHAPGKPPAPSATHHPTHPKAHAPIAPSPPRDRPRATYPQTAPRKTTPAPRTPARHAAHHPHHRPAHAHPRRQAATRHPQTSFSARHHPANRPAPRHRTLFPRPAKHRPAQKPTH